jgi:hypothetical protein
MARRAAKCFSTSTFLIRPIGTPVVPLVSSASMVRTAEDSWIGASAGCQLLR